MGRPLWVEPTKKSTPSDATAQSRSSIRRPSSLRRSATDRRQHLREAREARLRSILAAQPDAGLDPSWNRPRSLRTNESREARNALPPHPSMPLQYDGYHLLDPELAAFGDWSPRELSELRAIEENRFPDTMPPSRGLMRHFAERITAETAATESLVRAEAEAARAVTEAARADTEAVDILSIAQRMARRAGRAERAVERAMNPHTSQVLRSTRRTHARNVDGLGDRDRSPTPESDAAWNTLQSTLTPDPQPPSAGSSFARVEEPEPPCDPLNELDPEHDSLSHMSSYYRRSFNTSLPPSRRSYADVLRVPSDTSPSEAAEDPEWLAGMHHIVRNLASRQDIPDEWWAEAGLSRSMSWEDDS
ncbi:Protein kinase of the Mitotic Exit Network [Hypoxylon texense]